MIQLDHILLPIPRNLDHPLNLPAFSTLSAVSLPQPKTTHCILGAICGIKGTRANGRGSAGSAEAPTRYTLPTTKIQNTKYSRSPRTQPITVPSRQSRLVLSLPFQERALRQHPLTPQRSLSTRASVRQRVANPATPHYVPPPPSAAQNTCYAPC